MSNLGAYGPIRSVTTPVLPPTGEDYEAVLSSMRGFAAYYGVTGGAGRAPILVSSSANSGPNTLRQALSDAGSAGGGWIYFTQGMTATINISSQLALVSNITIDGRGADITVTNSGGKGFQGTGTGGNDRNIIFLYLKVDGCGNDCIEFDHGSDLIWLYHCTFSDSVDEVLSMRRTLGKYTVQDCLLDNQTNGGRGCLISTSAPNLNEWDTKVQEGTYYRTIFDCNQRQPRVTASSHIHLYNCYQTNGNSNGNNCLASIATSGALAPEILFENNIADGGSRCLRTIGANLGDAKARASGNLMLNGVNGPQENLPDEVFIPPYTYAEMVAATTTLRDDLIANAGWQSSVNPIH